MFRRAAILAATFTLAAPATAQLSAPHRAQLAQALKAPTRTPANVARDKYRNPAGTLAFFGVKPSDTVVEISPGRGWYSEILVPYLTRGGGSYHAATSAQGVQGFRTFVGTNPQLYGAAKTAVFPVRAAGEQGVPAASADVVLTFRNVHNWAMGDEPYAELAFKQMYDMLKPGGTLGVVDHRLPERADAAREKNTGYLKTSTVRRLAEGAGFRFAGASEVNANPRDTADHVEGVWTLPPTLRLGDKDRAKYLAIGESDRMTLKFVKPR